ncbi:DNA polymerase family A-domain-containing protein [Phlyctochytrium arcticum]|nr:DNA polymerase family A-domain-containing protein [Phlyctochytrium arcticum]
MVRPFSGAAKWRCVLPRSRIAVPTQRYGTSVGTSQPPKDAIASEETCRKNEVGIHMISSALHSKLFPKRPPGESLTTATDRQRALAFQHLEEWNLLGKALPPQEEVTIDLPELTGNTIKSHFRNLGLSQASHNWDQAERMARTTLPPMPKRWTDTQEGWIRYDYDGSTHAGIPISFPPEDTLVFDVEVMYKVCPYPVIAIAAGTTHWYSWISPGFLSNLEPEYKPKTLISFGDCNDSRLIIGHHVAYDRARILEEYKLQDSQLAFLDTMSLHSAVGGLSSQQRPAWRLYKKEEKSNAELKLDDDPEKIGEQQQGLSKSETTRLPSQSWWQVSSMNNLKDTAELYLKKTLDKSLRSEFESTDFASVRKQLQQLLTYCAEDVAVTQELFQKLWPRFKEKCPHPVSFAGMLHMGKGYLPISSDWNRYVTSADDKYAEYQDDIRTRLTELVEEAVKRGQDGKWEADAWLRNLNWKVPAVRMTNPVIAKDGTVKVPARPYKKRGIPESCIGKPNWYLELYDKKLNRLEITLSKRIAPYLLGLQWKGFPLYWTKKYGWTYVVPRTEASTIKIKPLEFPSDPVDKDFDARASVDGMAFHYQVPHPAGEGVNVGSPLSKSFISAFEDGTLTSNYPAAQFILERNAQCAYWTSAKGRVSQQFLVWGKDIGEDVPVADGNEYGVILPQSISMGTVTRRAVESTWMTAANAKKNRIGSELKTQIQAPKGWKIIGADVDSEELWIASLLGDAQFGIHGATAIGFMTLQGTKKAATDLHSVTGSILGISRDNAKVFNYGRIYGAGVKHAVQLLLQNSPGLSREQATNKAQELYAKTKGKRFRGYNPWQRKEKIVFWYGGSESHMFNKLEEVALDENPRTPVLGCGIPDSLLTRYVAHEYMTSRVNWVVQSSGVDYLHLLLVAMKYLMDRLKIKGRFMISIHDEVRFLVKEEHQILGALALQIANVWARAMFAESVGMRDLPLSVAFFSSVDIDHCLRKEVDMDCITPSNNKSISAGRGLNIYELQKELAAWQSATGTTNLYGPELPSISQIGSTIQRREEDENKKLALSPNEKRYRQKLAELIYEMDMRRLEMQLESTPEQVRLLHKRIGNLVDEIRLTKYRHDTVSQAGNPGTREHEDGGGKADKNSNKRNLETSNAPKRTASKRGQSGVGASGGVSGVSANAKPRQPRKGIAREIKDSELVALNTDESKPDDNGH